jgi:hypothetical protein
MSLTNERLALIVLAITASVVLALGFQKYRDCVEKGINCECTPQHCGFGTMSTPIPALPRSG